MASSRVTASPHIPAHFDGKAHPVGGAAGAVAARNEENLEDAESLPDAVNDELGAAVMHVKGLAPVARAADEDDADDEDEVRSDVWQHESDGGGGVHGTFGWGWTVCRRVLSTSNGVMSRLVVTAPVMAAIIFDP